MNEELELFQNSSIQCLTHNTGNNTHICTGGHFIRLKVNMLWDPNCFYSGKWDMSGLWRSSYHSSEFSLFWFVKQTGSCFHRKSLFFHHSSMTHKKQWDHHQILSHLHLPPSHTLSGWRLLISHLQSSFTWNPFLFFPHLSVCPFWQCKPAPFQSLPCLNPFTSIFPTLATPPQRLSAPPTVSVLPLLLAPHWVGWQERRHRQQGVGWPCQRALPSCWVTGIRALLWSVFIPFWGDIEGEGEERSTGLTWQSPHGGHGTG